MDVSSTWLEDLWLGPRPFGGNEVHDASNQAQGGILLKVEQLSGVPLPWASFGETVISHFCQQALGIRPDWSSLLNKYECPLEFGMGIVIPKIAQVLGQFRTWNELKVDINYLISDWSHLKKTGESREDYREKFSQLQEEVRANQAEQQEVLQKILETFGQQVQKLEGITKSQSDKCDA